jgi:GTPase SAR1 family protein
MNNYDFSVLNDKEFEEIVRDLLSADLSIKLRTFKKGKDKGIDMRYSTVSNINEIIVQCKHYPGSGIKELLRILRPEKVKIEKLAVSNYYIAVSARLLPQHENEIFSMFSPMMKTPGAVYGRERLNQILQSNEKIENTHFKLWISSTNVFNRIIHNSIKGRSEFYVEKIQANIKKYVPTKAFAKALAILKKHHYVLITGQPGVGKTTLSHMLIYSFLSKDYELIVVDRDLKEAEQLISVDSKTKQIFYFDDFLGATYFDVLNPKTSDGLLVNFLERITQSKNKFLILSARTTILNSAFQIYEKLTQSNISIGRKELELTEYNDLDKAKILYNHLYQSKLSLSDTNVLFSDKTYLQIIKHPNYNPRLIEFITDRNKFEASGIDDYLKFVLTSLENPKEIWRQSIANQVKDEDRFLLFTLFTLGGTSQENVLEFAFSKKLEYEINHSGFTKPFNTYQSVLGRLLDGHLTRTKDTYNEIFQVSFINPSLQDYLTHFIQSSLEERRRVLQSIIYIEQFEHFYNAVLQPLFADKKNLTEQNELLLLLKKTTFFTMLPYGEMKTEMTKCKILNVYNSLIGLELIAAEIDELCRELIGKINFETIKHSKFLYFFLPVMEENLPEGKVESFIKDNWNKIIQAIWANADSKDEIDTICELYEKYENDLSSYLLETPNRIQVEATVSKVLNQTLHDEVGYRSNTVYDRSDRDDLKKELNHLWENMYKKVKLPVSAFNADEFLPRLGDEEFEENKKDDEEVSASLKKITSPITKGPHKEKDFTKQIEALFER